MERRFIKAELRKRDLAERWKERNGVGEKRKEGRFGFIEKG